jgi:hypothetical protein
MSRKLDLRHGDAASGRGTCHGATQPPAGPRWQRLITVPVTARGPTAPGPAVTEAGTVRSDSGTQRQASLANLKPRPGAGHSGRRSQTYTRLRVRVAGRVPVCAAWALRRARCLLVAGLDWHLSLLGAVLGLLASTTSTQPPPAGPGPTARAAGPTRGQLSTVPLAGTALAGPALRLSVALMMSVAPPLPVGRINPGQPELAGIQ